MKGDLSTCHLMAGWLIQIGEKVIQGSAVRGLHRGPDSRTVYDFLM